MVATIGRCLAIASYYITALLLTGLSDLCAQDSLSPDSATVEITSSPVNGFIFVDGQDMGLVTPAEFVLPIGEQTIEVLIDGYEPLSRRITIRPGKRVSMSYVLRTLPPPQITADSLGLERPVKIPLIDEKIAHRLERKWTGLAEVFAIVPLGQGVLARLTLPNEHHKAANVMIISGAGLTVGSYFLGKILGKRKLKQIRARNEEIPRLNESIQQRIAEIDEIVREANNAATSAWMTRNEDRGTVTVKVE